MSTFALATSVDFLKKKIVAANMTTETIARMTTSTRRPVFEVSAAAGGDGEDGEAAVMTAPSRTPLRSDVRPTSEVPAASDSQVAAWTA